MTFTQFIYTSAFIRPNQPTTHSQRTAYCTSIKEMRRLLALWDNTSGPHGGTYQYHETPIQLMENEKEIQVNVKDIPPHEFIYDNHRGGYKGCLASAYHGIL
jgi:hypothetical protein